MDYFNCFLTPEITMKTRIFLSSLLIIAFSIQLHASKIVGVTAFSNLSRQKSLNWLQVGIADSISYKLRNIKDYIVIDRTNVDKVLNEIRLGQSGFINEKLAKQAGKALNADILVVGNFQVYGKRVRIHAKLVDVESHKILKQVQATGTMDDIFDLQDKIAFNIIKDQDVSITDEIRDRMRKNYTKNLSAYEYFSKGQKFYYQTNYREAIKLFKKAVSIDKRYSLAYAGLGKAYANLYWKMKNYSNKKIPEYLQRSYEYSTKALAYSPNLDEAHLSLAKYYQNVDKKLEPKKWKKCEEKTKEVIRINPNNGEAYFLMSRIYGYNDNKEERYLKKAIAKNNFIADAHNNLGIIYTDQGKYEEAKEAFRRAIKVDPEYKTAYMNIGVVYDKEKKHRKALEMYKLVVKKYPDYPLGLVNLGIGYRRLKEYDKALIYFKRSVKVKPDYAFGWGEVAYIYLQKKQYHRAVTNYKKSLRYDYKNKYSLANLGFTYMKLKNYRSAKYYLKKCTRYHKNYAWPAGQLGWIYRYKEQDEEEALKWYREALRRQPSNSSYRRSVRELSNGGRVYAP